MVVNKSRHNAGGGKLIPHCEDFPVLRRPQSGGGGG
jgi:hypothetical protein